MTLAEHIARLREALDAPAPPLYDVIRDMSLAHAAHLRALGPVRTLALDPCPYCGGTVVASEDEARCTTDGCCFRYRRLA